MADTLALRIWHSFAPPELVALLRPISGLPVSRIAAALTAGEALPICELFGRDHEEKERSVLALLKALSERGEKFDIVLRGRVEPLEIFHNLLERYYQIGYDVQMEMELESGEPSEEALRWASGEFEYPKREG